VRPRLFSNNGRFADPRSEYTGSEGNGCGKGRRMKEGGLRRCPELGARLMSVGGGAGPWKVPGFPDPVCDTILNQSASSVIRDTWLILGLYFGDA